MSSADGQEVQVLPQKDGPGSPPPYTPPPQFKEINTPPLLPESLPNNAELWLVRIQDYQLKPDECKGKQVALTLNSLDGKMGCFENSKGSSFEILDLHNVAGVNPFAFLPKSDLSLEVRRVSRQVSIVRSLEPITLSRPSSNVGQHDPSEPNGIPHVRSLHKQKQVPSILHKSERGTGAQIKEEGRALSASLSVGVGGLSTVESLQDDEERISTGKLGKSSKKSKRDEASLNSEVELSPLVSSRKDLEVHEEQASSRKKSRKHKKTKQEDSG